MSRLVFSLLVPVVCAAAAPAQDAHDKVRRLISKDAVFVLECDGPGRLKKTFADTQLGKLVGDKMLVDWFTSEVRRDNKGKKSEIPEGMTEEEYQQILLSFNGRVLVAIRGKAKPDGGQIIHGAVVIHDPQNQLTRLTSLYTRKLLEENDSYEEVKIAGTRLYVEEVTNGEDGGTLPFKLGKYQAILVGPHATRRARKLITRFQEGVEDQVPEQAPDTARAPFALQIDFGNLLSKLRETDPRLKFMQTMWKPMGMDSLGTISLAVSPRGKNVGYTVSFRMRKAAELGLFSCLFPPAGRRSPLLQTFPFEVSDASGFYLDLGELSRKFIALINTIREERGEEPVALGELEDQFGVRLQKDFLDHLSGDVFLLANSATDSSAEEPSPASLYCFGLCLKDARAFAAGLEKVLRKSGLHAARKTRDFRKFKVHSLRLPTGALSYAITPRYLLISPERGGGAEAMRMVMSREAALDAGEEAPKMPRDMRRAFSSLPSDFYSRSLQDLLGMSQTLVELAGRQPDRGLKNDADSRRALEMLKMLPVLMRKYGIKRTYGTTHYQGRSIVWRKIF